MTLGQYIRQCRDARGIKAGWVADKLEVTRQRYWTWEADKHQPPARYLLAMVDVIGLDLEKAASLDESR